MKLTQAERLIVTMLTDLAKPADKRELDFEFIGKAVRSGQEWAIDGEYPILAGEGEGNGSENATFVGDVLSMWQGLEHSASNFSDIDWETYESFMGRRGRSVKFPGFDGNNEYDLLGAARFLVEELGRFSTFKGRELNSHMPSADRYRRMLEKYSAVRDKGEYGKLGPEDLAQVVSA